MKLTEARLREMLEECESATPGPWAVGECSSGGAILRRGDETGERRTRHPQAYLQVVPNEDCRHIANLDPTTAARLIRVALAARRLIANGCVTIDGRHADWIHAPRVDYDALARELEDTP